MQYLITQAANGLIVQPVKRDTVVSNEFLPEGEPYVYKVGNGALDLKDALQRVEAQSAALFSADTMKPPAGLLDELRKISADMSSVADKPAAIGAVPLLTEEAAEHLPA